MHLIRGYSAHELKINDQSYQDAVILSPRALLTDASLATVADLCEAHAARILELDPELVLLGSGPKQVFPAASFGAHFLRAGVGFEVMDTGAACRTFNVLAAEQRRVVAILIVSKVQEPWVPSALAKIRLPR